MGNSIGTVTPWGVSEEAEQLGQEVVRHGTPSHGGLEIGPKALRAIPEEVRATFITAGWAEEDCEAPIALAFLMDAGELDQYQPRDPRAIRRRAVISAAESGSATV